MNKILHLLPFFKIWYRDKDGDGYGDSNDYRYSPTQPNGYVNTPGDPDDTNPNIYPGSGGNNHESSIKFTNTNQLTNPMLHGFVMENTWFKKGDSPIVYDIQQEPFFSNINSLKFKIIAFPGTQPEHYWVAYENNSDPDTPPTLNGGFDCSLCLNTNTYCCNPYNVNGTIQSVFPKFVNFCKSLDIIPYTLIQPNPGNYNTAAYVWSANYLDTETRGFKGFYLNEFSDSTWAQCLICGNASAVALGCNTIYDAVYNDGFTNINYVSDWKGVFIGQKYSDSYSLTQLNNIDKITGTRAYFGEQNIIPREELISGRPPSEYKVSIDTGIDIHYPTILTGIKNITNLPVAATQAYTIAQTGFGNTYLQYYFYSRLKVKEALIEAQTPGTIAFSLFLRADTIDAKNPNMNILGELVKMFGQFYEDESLYVHTMEGPSGTYGIGAINPNDGSGYAILINPNETEINENSVMCNGISKDIIDVNWIAANIISGACFKGTGGIPKFSICLLTF